jgi:arylsulfatase
LTGRRLSPAASVLAGAAGGAVAFALVAAVEIVGRLFSGPPLLAPYRDLSTLAAGGAGLGLLLGLLRLVPGLRTLAPFGIALGVAVALRLWLEGVTGTRLLGDAALGVALRGALLLLAGAALGQLLGLALRRLPRRPHPNPARDLFLTAILVGIGLIPLPRGSSPGAGPNILLLTIDTLRSDRLGFAGHPVPVSPHLDRLARQSLEYRRGVTPLPRTLPAVTSIMTGLVPHAHGVRDNFHYALGDGPGTLAERFAAAGWATAAVNSNPVLSHDSGVYRGFESANDRGDDWSRLATVRGVQRIVTLARMQRGDRAQVITDLALDWLAHRPDGKPFLLWVHWLSPHMPYEPAPPFDRIFDPSYEGEFAGRIDYTRISKGAMTYRNPLSARDLVHVKALYDGEVATADRALGRLLRSLEASGELDRTVVLFTSDHGESLDEHGYFLNHGDFVYGPAANVPFLLRVPDARAGLVPGLAGLTDVLPRLEAVAGLTRDPASPPEPAARFGESGFCRFPELNDRLGWLLPQDVARNPELINDWQSEWQEQANRSKQRYLEEGRFKLVLTPRPDGDVVELFDLEADPAETRDVADAHPEITRALEERLRAWIEEGNVAAGAAEGRTISDDLREQMEGLGYIGS